MPKVMACMRGTIDVATKGSVMVSLLQRHLEHLGDACGGGGGLFCSDVPPHVFYRMVDVNFLGLQSGFRPRPGLG